MYESTAELELFISELYDEGVVSEVIRPAAVLPEDAARRVLTEITMHDVRAGGLWFAEPSLWRRYDRPWDGPAETAGSSQLIGSLQVAYGTPTRYEITIYRVTLTQFGQRSGWDVQSLSNSALSFADLSLGTCPRADLRPPPKPFRLR